MENRMRLVCIHGAGSTSAIWSKMLPYLSDDNVFIELVDLPGHHFDLPGTPRSGVYPLPDEAKDCSVPSYAAAVVNHLRSSRLAAPSAPTILVGHSMGGAIALQLAHLHPDLINGLVLITTGARLRVNSAFLEQLRSGSYDPAFSRTGFSPNTKNETIIQEVIERNENFPVGVSYHDFNACNQFDIREFLGEIETPALVIAGQDDLLTPVKYSEYLAAHLPNASLIIVKNAGHYLPVEQPEQLADRIRFFIAELH